jgi:hypothetical protein
MPITFPNLREMNAMVSPEILAQQGFRRPKRVVVSSGEDADGAKAIRVWVIYPDSVPEAELSMKLMKPLRDWIFNTLWAAVDCEQWIYVFVRQESFVPDYLQQP